MKKNLLAVLLILTMLTALVSGCGGNTDSSAESPSVSSVSETTTVADTPSPEASAVSDMESAEASSSVEDSAEIQEIPQVTYPLTEEPVTFSLWYSFPGDLADIMQEYLGNGKSNVLQAVEERTGVSLRFMLQSVTTANDNFNLLVASGDYPDLFQNAGSYYTGGLDKAVDEEVLVDLDGYDRNLRPQLQRPDPSG